MFLGVLTPGTRGCKPLHGLPLLSLHPQVLTHLHSLFQVTNILPAYTDQHCCSVAQSCLTLCDPADGSTPAFPVLRQLPELTKAHVHRGGDAVPPSHPLSPPSPPALNLPQTNTKNRCPFRIILSLPYCII